MHDLSGYRRTEVGLVFQFHNLLPQLSALFNVELPMFGLRMSARQRKSRARDLLRRWTQWLRTPPPNRTLGWGTQCGDRTGSGQRAQILLADRPTGSLDSVSTTRFLELLDRLGSSGVTIVTVTHASDIAAHAQRIVEMRDRRRCP